MKDVNGGDAIRKVRKSLRKSLKSDDSQNELEFLYKVLSDNRLRAAVTLFDRLEPCANAEAAIPPAETNSSVDSVQTALDELYMAADRNDDAMELCDLLTKPHMRSLLEAHDTIAQKKFLPDVLPPPPGAGPAQQTTMSHSSGLHQTYPEGQRGMGPDEDLPTKANGDFDDPQRINDAHKADQYLANIGPQPPDGPLFDSAIENMVTIRKVPGEDLGITVGIHEFSDGDEYFQEVVVERVMAGSTIERRGVLHPGDIIREVDGLRVDTPEVLQKMIKDAKPGTITLKIVPAVQENQRSTSLFVRAHVSYNPDYDTLIPCHEAGLRFTAGDVLQVVNQSDPYWWQAKKFGEDMRAGLIPSITLQERRKAYEQSAPDQDVVQYKVFGCGLRKKKKVKMVYTARVAQEFEKNDLVIYEEVALIPAFQRKVICLLGAQGVGRTTLKDRLIRSNPDRYTRVIPHTSRPRRYDEEDGVQYFFVSRAEMEADISAQQYLEYGEYDYALYGTKLDTIRSFCSGTGKTVILDCSPTALKQLRTPEFMPYVVFIAAPSVDCMKAMYEYGRSMGFTNKWKQDEDFRATIQASIDIERNHRHLFDFVIINDNLDVAFENLEEHVNDLLQKQQWVPVNWLY